MQYIIIFFNQSLFLHLFGRHQFIYFRNRNMTMLLPYCIQKECGDLLEVIRNSYLRYRKYLKNMYNVHVLQRKKTQTSRQEYQVMHISRNNEDGNEPFAEKI